MNSRLLIIDDNPSIHADIRKILSKTQVPDADLEEAEAALFGAAAARSTGVGFEIDSAFQGGEGIQKLREAVQQNRPYAMAFIDVRMPPGLDGIETLSGLWDVDPNLQVVVCTAYSDYSWEEMARKVGKPDSVLILKKPFDNIEVLQMAHALTKKWELANEIKSRLNDLDALVHQRTKELQSTNDRLTAEIAERILTERELRLSKERFTKAFRSSPVAMAIQSLDGDFLDVNESFVRMIGHDRSDILGKSGFELAIWPYPEARWKMLRALAYAKSIRNVEGRLRTKSGEDRQTLVSAELIELGSDSFALMSEHDITQRLQLEEQLRHAQKMQAVGHLAAGVAHDFRNMLTVIQGHTNLRLLDSSLDPKMQESLKEISGAVDRSAKLTRQLLTFSRKESIQPQPVNLNDVIAQIGGMLSRVIGEHITLKLDPQENLPMVEADLTSVEQVLMNLVVNARDAMPNGGVVTISTNEMIIDSDYVALNSEATAGRFARVTVRDTGSGIDDATRQRLFEPFFTTKETGKGTGMGLATVYGIVRQHNGCIQVDSKPGQGSSFHVYLPLSSKTPQLAEKAASITSGPYRGYETILVVEDEEPVRRFVSEVLRDYGYEVHAARTGAEALKIWHAHKGAIDLLLTDVVMPDAISGIQLADQLRSQNVQVKVIFTSGYSFGSLDGWPKALSDVTFVPKPFHPLKLAETIRSCLDDAGPKDR